MDEATTGAAEGSSRRFVTREAILNAPDRPVIVEIADVGEVRLRPANEYDLDWLRNALSEIPDPRVLGETVLHRQTTEGSVADEQIPLMRDETLFTLVEQWLRDALGDHFHAVADLPSLPDAVRAGLDRRDAPLREILESSYTWALDRLNTANHAWLKQTGAMDFAARTQMLTNTIPHIRAGQRMAEFAPAGAGFRQNFDHLPSVGTPRVVGELLAAEERIRMMVQRTRLPSFEMTEAITSAYASALKVAELPAATAIAQARALRSTTEETLRLREIIDGAVQRFPLSRNQAMVLQSLDRLTIDTVEYWQGLADDPDRFAAVSEEEREESVATVFQATKSTALLLTADPEAERAEAPVGLLRGDMEQIVPRLERLHFALVVA